MDVTSFVAGMIWGSAVVVAIVAVVFRPRKQPPDPPVPSPRTRPGGCVCGHVWCRDGWLCVDDPPLQKDTSPYTE